MIHQILFLLGEKSFWHEDKLHLAEWQALQQIEYLFNVTLTIDGKSTALVKWKAHKERSFCQCEVTDVSDSMNKLQSADDDELHAFAST